ncbi:MAG: MFS transporter [Candidatus Thermoplasmatota archaeon]
MKLSLINLLQNAGGCATLIFIPILASELGASTFDVGVIVCSYALACFFSSYVFGRKADIIGRKKVLGIGLISSTIVFPLHIFAYNPFTLTLIRILSGICIGIYPSALITYAYETSGRVGKVASFGSLGWGIGSFVAGLIGLYFGIFLLSTFFFLIAFIVTLTLPEKEEKKIYVPLFPISVIKKNFDIYISLFLRHTGASGLWAVFPLYLLFLGADKFWIGFIYLLNFVCQFLFMPYVERYSYIHLPKIGFLLTMIAFLGYMAAPNYIFIIPFEILIAIAWSCIYVGCLRCVMNEEEKATGAGLIHSTTSISGVIGPLIGGAVAQLFGYKGIIFLGILLAFGGLLLLCGKKYLRFKP